MSDRFGYSTSKTRDYLLKMADSESSSSSDDSSEHEMEVSSTNNNICEVCNENPVYQFMTRKEKRKTIAMLISMKMDKSEHPTCQICFKCWHFIRDTWKQYRLFLGRLPINTARYAILVCFLCNSSLQINNIFVNRTFVDVLQNMNLSLPEIHVNTFIFICNACELLTVQLQRLYCLTIYKRLAHTPTNMEDEEEQQPQSTYVEDEQQQPTYVEEQQPTYVEEEEPTYVEEEVQPTYVEEEEQPTHVEEQQQLTYVEEQQQQPTYVQEEREPHYFYYCFKCSKWHSC